MTVAWRDRLPDGAIGIAHLVDRARGVAVGDRILVTVETSRPAADPYGDRERVTEVVTVDEITVMGCGCSRAGFDRPRSSDGPCPRVHVFSAGCRWSGDHVDFAAARDAAQLYDAKAASVDDAASSSAQGLLFEVAS